MSEKHPVILHHFEVSPLAEVIRLIFGFKRIPWKSVVVSRILPRPELMALTGGYRRTPVMQIGADIFCDTQTMIRELEARYPEPTLFPDGNEGICWAAKAWIDRAFFPNAVTLVFGALVGKVPQSLIDDRTLLRGAAWDPVEMARSAPQMRDHFRAHLGWVEEQLRDGREWMLGSFSLADISCYMPLYYARVNLDQAGLDASGIAAIFREYPKTMAWEKRVKAVGHGSRADITPQQALEIAAANAPACKPAADANDPNGRKPGDRIVIEPDDFGKVPVRGELVASSAQGISVRRFDEQAGEVIVHFPRAGYSVAADDKQK